jgi:hypothetical protein
VVPEVEIEHHFTKPDGKTPSPEGKVGFIRPKRLPSGRNTRDDVISTGSKIFE